MGWAMFCGCSFITFGPAFALFIFTVTGSPVRVIILVVGKTNSGLASFRVKGVPPLSLQQKALVSGLAFGLMSSAFSFANILSLSLGPGIVGIHGESSHFFITSALQSMMQTCLHICWSVLLFSACERASRVRGVAVVMTHLLSCGLSFLNPRYYLSLLLQCVLVAAVVIWAWVAAGGRGCPGWLGVGDKPLVKVETVQYSALMSPVMSTDVIPLRA